MALIILEIHIGAPCDEGIYRVFISAMGSPHHERQAIHVPCIYVRCLGRRILRHGLPKPLLFVWFPMRPKSRSMSVFTWNHRMAREYRVY